MSLLRWGPRQATLRSLPGQNVLLITVDTLRADAMSCAGGPAVTPALDRLAAEGVRFDFAHAHAVITLTSHASILTGRYPFEHGLRDNSGYRLPASARTVATLLKAAGYRTAAFVAAFPLHSRFGLGVGFDVYDDRFGQTHAPTEFGMPERPASEVVPLARGWIASRDGTSERWFVWLHLFDPHAPYRPPPPFDSQYAGRPYYGEVAAVDRALAPLLSELEHADRPTFVVMTGDHGEALGEHGEQSHGLFAYESTLHVPLIVAEIGGSSGQVPGTRYQVPAGEVSSVGARHIDILPTILDAVGQPVPGDLPGRSLLPPSERRSGAAPRVSYFEAMAAMLNRGWAPLAGVLVGHDKVIDLPIPERYDLSADPGERVNLAGRSPERDRVLRAALEGIHASMPGQRAAETGEVAAQLRALGYVSGSAKPKPRYTEDDDPKRLVDLDQAIHRAVEAFGAGRGEEAAETYRGLIARRPDMALAYRHLAFIQARRGDLPGAIKVLRDAVGAGVDEPPVLTQLGEYLADTGKTAEALQLLVPLARSAEADPDTVNTLGITYAEAGRIDDARTAFERVLSIDPESSIPLENLGLIAIQRGDLWQARGYFERAVKAEPRSSRAQAGLGLVALKGGDRKTAIEAWQTAVDLDPTNYEALYNLGVTLERDGQTERARPYLEQFLTKAPPALYASDLREIARLMRKDVR